MAEQRNQTPAGDNTQWTTIIRPRTGWFDVDLEELWRYRDLIVMFVKRNFTVMYKQTILGPLWIILNPLITTVLFNVVFGGIAGLSTDGTPSFLFYMAGNTVWTFFASCINGTANTFVANSQVFGKVYFPRLTTPISQVLTSLINFFIQFVMYILFWVYFAVTGSGVHLTAWAFAVPLVVLEVMLLGLGVGIIVSALTTKYRDLAIAVSFGVQLWMYISPVVYPLSSLEPIPHFDVQGDDQPPFLLAYGNAFFGQGAVAQRFAHCAGGRALAHGGNTVTVFGSFGHKAREVIIRKRNMSQRIHSCDHLRSSLWNTDEFPASGLTLLPGSMCVSYS